MRELYIKNGQGFILVYSVTDESSLQELMELREQVVRIKDNENVPMVLVANKADLETQREVTSDLGVNVANHWGKTPFYETSAKYRSNIDEVFTDLVRQIMRRDSAFGVGAPCIKGGAHSTTGSIDDANYVYSQHQKRVSNASSQSSITQQASQTSLFKLKQRQQSRDNLPRYQQPLSPQQQNQLHLMQTNQSQNFLSLDPTISNQSQTVHKKASRGFLKSPHTSKSMPALRKKKLSGQAKDKECVICWAHPFFCHQKSLTQSFPSSPTLKVYIIIKSDRDHPRYATVPKGHVTC